jgi:hypothetical protein
VIARGGSAIQARRSSLAHRGELHKVLTISSPLHEACNPPGGMRSPISASRRSASSAFRRSKKQPVDLGQRERHLGRTREAARMIDQDDVPRRIEQDIAGVVVDIADEVVEMRWRRT